MYQPLPPAEPLSQGDVIDDCPLPRLVATPEAAGSLTISALQFTSRVVVLTQACDLAQGKTAKVLVAAVISAQELVDSGVIKAAVIRDQVRRGSVYGWYFLPAAPAPLPVPESVVDLRELHTLPREVLEQLIASSKRVCRVVTPYREHLAQHFAVTYMRIGLPEPYPTAP